MNDLLGKAVIAMRMGRVLAAFSAALACTAVSTSCSADTLTPRMAALIEEGAVIRVVDGDTVVVDASGDERYVRLIGIDAPESVSPDESENCEEGRAASAFAEALMPPGTKVYLQSDVSEKDRYGRCLRYVWLEEPPEHPTADDVGAMMANGIMVGGGLAAPAEYPPDVEYAWAFDILMFQAEKEGRGFSRVLSSQR